ncbi:cupredoxin domain-containing protein [Candidatus Woesearchaeota archaeon]|nr:cupredoxin domain-containing protein [Candidatus Woesearchaeota archaeon]MBW3016261.1 cupredoxin domain-containing protein [Candidatus Woesearchaeota archaeon]
MKKLTILLTLLLLAACAQEVQERPTTIPQIEITVPKADFPDKPQYEPPPSAPVEKTTEHKIDATIDGYKPSEITVNKGDKVKLTVLAIDIPHAFTMPAYNINEELKVGEDVIIEFTADKEGTFTFYCDKPGHDMRGKLTVK